MKCVICGREFDGYKGGVNIHYDDGRLACTECSIKRLNELDGLGDVLAHISTTSYEDLKKEADE